jgi:hypothetical protein
MAPEANMRATSLAKQYFSLADSSEKRSDDNLGGLRKTALFSPGTTRDTMRAASRRRFKISTSSSSARRFADASSSVGDAKTSTAVRPERFADASSSVDDAKTSTAVRPERFPNDLFAREPRDGRASTTREREGAA